MRKYDLAKEPGRNLLVTNQPCIQAGFVGSHLMGVEEVGGSPRYVAISEPDHFQTVLLTLDCEVVV